MAVVPREHYKLIKRHRISIPIIPNDITMGISSIIPVTQDGKECTNCLRKDVFAAAGPAPGADTGSNGSCSSIYVSSALSSEEETVLLLYLLCRISAEGSRSDDSNISLSESGMDGAGAMLSR